jgi:hypothetical protein
MKIITLLYTLLLSQLVNSSDLQRIVKLKKVYIETEKHVKSNRSYYLNNQNSAEYDLNLGLDFDLPANMYYTNKVVSITDDSQFRFIGLHFELGGNIIDNMQFYLRHFSGHAMDDSFKQDFPQDNTIGIRFILYGNKWDR